MSAEANVSQVSECLPQNIQAQIEQKQTGRRKHVFHGGAVCSGCYSEPPEPGQRYGKICRNQYAANFRKDRTEELKRLRATSGDHNG